MAFLTQRTCRECKQEKTVDGHTFNGTCPQCKAEKYDREKRMFLAGLKGLTTEERLSRIEEYIYDLPKHLQNSYERKHHRYA